MLPGLRKKAVAEDLEVTEDLEVMAEVAVVVVTEATVMEEDLEAAEVVDMVVEEEEVIEMEAVEEVATEEAAAVEDMGAIVEAMVETVEVTESVTTSMEEEATTMAATITTKSAPSSMLLLSLLSVCGNESPLLYLSLSAAAFSDFAVSVKLYCTLKRSHLNDFNRRKIIVLKIFKNFSFKWDLDFNISRHYSGEEGISRRCCLKEVLKYFVCLSLCLKPKES